MALCLASGAVVNSTFRVFLSQQTINKPTAICMSALWVQMKVSIILTYSEERKAFVALCFEKIKQKHSRTGALSVFLRNEICNLVTVN